jgi:acetylglutamate kinase
MIIIKFGGHAMNDTQGIFAAAIKSVLLKGEQVIVVHGGGPQINAELKRRNIESTFVNGYRFTTDEIFEVVDEVLSKVVGPEVANNLLLAGVKAQAISGKKSEVIIAEGIDDLGKVGRVLRIDVSNVDQLLAQKIVPVISPIAVDVAGGAGLNINADLAAAAISGAYPDSTLIIMTDVAGIYRKWPDKSSLIEKISAHELSELKPIFADGMLPKVDATLEAIAAGAHSVRIIDGTDDSSFAAALDGKGGTLVYA